MTGRSAIRLRISQVPLGTPDEGEHEDGDDHYPEQKKLFRSAGGSSELLYVRGRQLHAVLEGMDQFVPSAPWYWNTRRRSGSSEITRM